MIAFWRQASEDNLFFHKVKPLTRYLNALRITLSGKYANFAIFGLVGDSSFEKTVKLSTEVLMCVSDEELGASDAVSLLKLLSSSFVAFNRATPNWPRRTSRCWRCLRRIT